MAHFHDESPQDTYVLFHEGRGLSYIFQVQLKSDAHSPLGVSIPIGEKYMVVRRTWLPHSSTDDEETMGAWTMQEARKLWKDLIDDGFRRTK